MITVVSGIPRSGTSLMMQIMAAGGLPLVTDGLRSPDINNPRGYYELQAIKSLSRNPEVVAQAEGKVIKVVSSLLPALSKQYQYRIIFMCRALEEVVASQNRMLERLGKEIPPTPIPSVIAAFDEHLTRIRIWLAQQTNIAVLYVNYEAVLHAPEEQARIICAFLGQTLDIASMARQIEHSLHRERCASDPAVRSAGGPLPE